MRVTIKIQDEAFKKVDRQLKAAMKRAVADCIDDLARTSSETTPHNKGILEKSFAKQVKHQGNGRSEGTVEFNVREGRSGGSYNYAAAMHEKTYRMRAGSLGKGGGNGMSGKHYPVGRKFLTRVLEGEQEAYKNHIENELKRQFNV
jgi:hypothetical protein